MYNFKNFRFYLSETEKPKFEDTIRQKSPHSVIGCVLGLKGLCQILGYSREDSRYLSFKKCIYFIEERWREKQSSCALFILRMPGSQELSLSRMYMAGLLPVLQRLPAPSRRAVQQESGIASQRNALPHEMQATQDNVLTALPNSFLEAMVLSVCKFQMYKYIVTISCNYQCKVLKECSCEGESSKKFICFSIFCSSSRDSTTHLLNLEATCRCCAGPVFFL